MKEFKDLRIGDKIVVWKSGENNTIDSFYLDDVEDGKEYIVIDIQLDSGFDPPKTESICIVTTGDGDFVWLDENEILNQKYIRNMKLKELLG